jgi:hypothetical protein
VFLVVVEVPQVVEVLAAAHAAEEEFARS